MIKIFRSGKSRRLYMGDETFDKNENFVIERTNDKFTISLLYAPTAVLWRVPFGDFARFDGSKFQDADECETYLHETVLSLELKIYRFMPHGENPLTQDFTLYSLGKESPSYDRGRKSESVYKDPVALDIVAKKTFIDVRNAKGRLRALDCRFDFYAEDGSIGLSKTDTVKKYNPFEAETEERKRRERQLDFLVAAGQDTDIEPVLDAIFDRYYSEQLHYKQKAGSTRLADAINSETDQTFLAYFQIRVPLVSDPGWMVPVKESILYQIGAISEMDLMATLTPNTLGG